MAIRCTNIITYLHSYLVADVRHRYCPKCGEIGSYCDTHNEYGLTVAGLGRMFKVRRQTMSNKVTAFRKGRKTWAKVIKFTPHREYPGQAEKCEKLGISPRSVRKWMNAPHNMSEDDAIIRVCENKENAHTQAIRSRAPLDVCELAAAFNRLPVLVDSITEGE
jgi:hypothetical protein